MSLTVVTAETFGTASATAAIQRPAGLQDGDLMVMSLQFLQGAGLTVEPNRWTLMTATATSAVGSFNDLGMKLYYLHASSEPASYSASFAFAEFYSYQIIVVRGQLGSSTAIDSPANIAVGASDSGALATIPAITISTTSSLRVAFIGQVGNAGSNPSHYEPPAGWTSQVQRVAASVSNAILTQDGGQASGVAAAASVSVSDFPAVGNWIGMSVAIREDPAFTASSMSVYRLMCLMGVGA